MSQSAERTILVVVDPAQDKPLALERILSVAPKDPSLQQEYSKHYQGAKLHILLAVDYDNTDTSAGNPAIHRDGRWFFDQVVDPLNQSGLQFQLQMSWSSDWYGSIIATAEKIKPELIMLPLVSKPSEAGRLFNESIWRLLRTAQCPVLVVRPSSVPERSVILSAIHIQSHKPEYQRLNDLIISRSQWMAQAFDGELHFVNAYSDSLNYPDRSQLAQKTGVDTARIHVRNGDPEQVIADVAKEVGADVVVIGTRNRGTRWRGNTADKIINRVNCDIMAIN